MLAPRGQPGTWRPSPTTESHILQFAGPPHHPLALKRFSSAPVEVIGYRDGNGYPPVSSAITFLTGKKIQPDCQCHKRNGGTTKKQHWPRRKCTQAPGDAHKINTKTGTRSCGHRQLYSTSAVQTSFRLSYSDLCIATKEERNLHVKCSKLACQAVNPANAYLAFCVRNIYSSTNTEKCSRTKSLCGQLTSSNKQFLLLKEVGNIQYKLLFPKPMYLLWWLFLYFAGYSLSQCPNIFPELFIKVRSPGNCSHHVT